MRKEKTGTTNEDWGSKFDAGLRAYAKGAERYLEEVIDVPIDDGFTIHYDPLVMAAVRTRWHFFAEKIAEDVTYFSEVTESPIEKAMASALYIVAYEHAETVRLIAHKDGKVDYYGDKDMSWNRLTIEAQKPIGDYRADFFLRYSEMEPGPEGTGIFEVREVIVECDGHDFHDRTKEQASRDRARDRAIQDLGFSVRRYTGADIWKDVFKCAEDAITSIADAKKRKFPPRLVPIPKVKASH